MSEAAVVRPQRSVRVVCARANCPYAQMERNHVPAVILPMRAVSAVAPSSSCPQFFATDFSGHAEAFFQKFPDCHLIQQRLCYE